MEKQHKARVVKVEGDFTEWYSPFFKDPYGDRTDYREYYDENILPIQPVIGPIVAGISEYLTGDLDCLADRITVNAVDLSDLSDWDRVRDGFCDAVEDALVTGEPLTFTFKGLNISITPFEKMPTVPEESYRVFGRFASLVKERVAAV